ncbi:MAG: hypothetical protein L0G87_09070 [Renibacterium salmoninarum]|nr:hypothetical protein [Renibacterium salmoninarum]
MNTDNKESKKNASRKYSAERIGPKTKRLIIISIILFFVMTILGNIMVAFFELWIVIVSAIVLVALITLPFAISAYREVKDS